MPPEMLRNIPLDVVNEDGDVAILRLSLTCRVFHDVVCEPFRKKAHFAWLDSKFFFILFFKYFYK